MAFPIVLTAVLAAADADGIAKTQTPLAGGNLTLNGDLVSAGVATLTAAGIARQVILTFAGADAGRTFVIYGTNATGNPISETLAGASSGVSTSVLYYRTVTRISVDAATADALTAGTNGVGVTRWASLNYDAQPFNLSIGAVLSGTANFTGQYTYDQVIGTTEPTLWADANLTGKSASAQSSLVLPVSFYRVKINSGDGTVTTTLLQAGIIGGS